MPAKSEKQRRYMAMLAHDPRRRAEAGISYKVAHDFSYKGDYEDSPRRKKKRNALTESEESDGRDSN